MESCSLTTCHLSTLPTHWWDILTGVLHFCSILSSIHNNSCREVVCIAVESTGVFEMNFRGGIVTSGKSRCIASPLFMASTVIHARSSHLARHPGLKHMGSHRRSRPTSVKTSAILDRFFNTSKVQQTESKRERLKDEVSPSTSIVCAGG